MFFGGVQLAIGPSSKLRLGGPTGNAETRDRTGDLQIFGLTLSQLSYRGSCSGNSAHSMQ